MPSLVDLTYAKRILKESGTSDDGTFHALLPAASALVEWYCGQNFDIRTSSYAFSSEVGVYNPFLFLVHRPLLAITELKNGNGSVIASTSYTLHPKFQYPKDRIRLNQGTYWLGPNDPTDCDARVPTLSAYAVDAIEVTGSWGYVPHYETAWHDSGLTVSGSHSASTTSIVLSGAVGSDLDVGMVIKIGDEQMRITGPVASFSAASTITVERGYNGTTAAAISTSTAVYYFHVDEIIKLSTAFVASALYVGRNNATGTTINVSGFTYQMNPDLWGKARQILMPPYFNAYYGAPYNG